MADRSEKVTIEERYVVENGELWPADPDLRERWKALYVRSPLALVNFDWSLVDSITETRGMTLVEFRRVYPEIAPPEPPA